MSWGRALRGLFLLGATLTAAVPARAADADPGPLRPEKYRPGEGFRFSTPSGFELRLFGYAQPFVEIKGTTGEDPPDTTARFRMRRLRVRLDGSAADDRVDYRLQVDLAGQTEADVDTPSLLLDAFARFRLHRSLRVSVGQRSTFTDNRELFMLSHTLQLPERSRVTSAFSSIREVGVFVEDRWRIRRSPHYLKPYFIVTSGDGASPPGVDRGGLKVGGRLDYLPLGLFYTFGQFREVDLARELTPKLVVGAALSHNRGMSSRRGRESGAILYLDADGDEALPDYTKLGVDFLFKYRGLTVLGEFTKTWARVPDTITQRVRNDGSVSSDFSGDVDAYVRGRMMLGEGYNLQAGYLFPFGLSVDGRATWLRPDEHSFLSNGTFYNRDRYLTGGVGAFLGPHYGLRVQGSLTHVNVLPGSNDIDGDPIDGDEWIGRLVTTVAF